MFVGHSLSIVAPATVDRDGRGDDGGRLRSAGGEEWRGVIDLSQRFADPAWPGASGLGLRGEGGRTTIVGSFARQRSLALDTKGPGRPVARPSEREKADQRYHARLPEDFSKLR
jgi:hypothetical protein